MHRTMDEKVQIGDRSLTYCDFMLSVHIEDVSLPRLEHRAGFKLAILTSLQARSDKHEPTFKMFAIFRNRPSLPTFSLP